jgi:hypothetical protein
MSAIRELKAKYPHPVRAIGADLDCYCVGGAFCLEFDKELSEDHRHFPNAYELFRSVLKFRELERDLLPDADYDKMLDLAEGVTQANDIGSFTAAWKLLGKLLTARVRQEFPQGQP